MRAAFKRLTGQAHGTPRDIDVRGRKVRIAEMAEGTAFVSFEDMCMKPLGSGGLSRLHRGVPHHHPVRCARIYARRRAEARRFITLIDTLYDAKTGLIVSADAEPDEMYPAGDEAFLFERTASRLTEMRTQAYLDLKSRAELAGRI